MSYVRTCDLCDRPITDTHAFELKIKRRKFSWHESWWTRIDAHRECVRRVVEASND